MPTEKMKKLKDECFQYFAEDLLQDSFDISQISVYTLGTSLTEANIAFSLLKLGACTNQTLGKQSNSHPGDVFEGNIHKTSVTLENPKLSDSQYIKELSSNIPKGIEFPGPAFGFEDVRSLESFTILVNGVSINSRLSEQHKNYHDLCCSQRPFLHNHLLKSISSKLAAEIIVETTNIANAVGAGKLSTVHGDITMWEKTLNAFEILGMNVGFLRAQLRQLLSLSFESSKHSKLEHACAKEEVTTVLPSNSSELEGRMVIVDSKMLALKFKPCCQDA